ncbi:hypothetical protein CASFOL_011582 [Castilleja foliolosa]|uniref:SANTA domain-containing protein n=1 Tax=Castilleja foliolosa TaxID=1961234 RepID=A0ABD3DXS5_9LAMI
MAISVHSPCKINSSSSLRKKNSEVELELRLLEALEIYPPSKLRENSEVELELRLLEALEIYPPSKLRGVHPHFVLYGLTEYMRRSFSRPFTADDVLKLLERFFNLEMVVLLHYWWLIKAGSDSHGKRLGIGGIASKGSQSIRCFSSAHIIKRHDAVTLGTIDGLTISVHGHLNRARTLENGFSREVCEHFEIGFPYYWEEYGAVSVDEEPTKFPSTPGGQGTNTSSGDIFDDILQKYDGAIHCSLASSAEKVEYNPTTKNVDSISTPDGTLPSHKKTKGEQKQRSKGKVLDIERSGGPLTRSRARLLRTNVSGGIC